MGVSMITQGADQTTGSRNIIREVVKELGRRPELDVEVLCNRHGLEAMRGRFDEARHLVDRSQSLYEDIGQSALAHANCGGIRGQIELLAGETDAAEQALRGTNAKFRRRFGHVESSLAAQGKTPSEAGIEEMETLWQQAKAETK